ncbi:hypothetical protein [Desulfonatronum sp. SC1]|uniref:hypothetical protein n=1 Tax=Desulfonatronum sp. SC1 TaxID=2109626 RepID=UPI000D314437|nr:hypothetical protein [Desulfonatronum sp. SC1]PTN32578.1 hypothetical protein C6366_16280 [Desulfonatronum sp. SC1]
MTVLDLSGVTCFVASPGGDLPVTANMMDVGLDGCDQGTTYGEYFAAIAGMLASDDQPVPLILARSLDRPTLPDGIVIRAEKHGALYHPASLELVWRQGAENKAEDDVRSRFAALTAISPRGRDALRREALVMESLERTPGGAFLPRPLAFRDDETVTFLIVTWFSGFHEFHVAEEGGFSLWDHDQGIRRLGAEQAREVFFQAGRILTLCLDPATGACVHPWSHAAGDFIVRWDDNGVQVRLTTARQHGPLIETENPLSALLAFVLDLALRMRLDRVEGVGEWGWLDQELMLAALQGFYAAVEELGEDAGALGGLAELLPSFSAEELLEGHESILSLFSRAELEVILPRLEAHCRELAAALMMVR